MKLERNQPVTTSMRQVVQNLLAEKSYKSEVCFHFFLEFVKRTDMIYPPEPFIPLWLVIAFEKPGSNGLFFLRFILL